MKRKQIIGIFLLTAISVLFPQGGVGYDTPFSGVQTVYADTENRLQEVKTAIDKETGLHYVSVGSLFEKFGFQAKWDEGARASVLTDDAENKLIFIADSKTYVANERKILNYYPTKIIDGSLCIPISTFNSQFTRPSGSSIKWDTGSNVVEITFLGGKVSFKPVGAQKSVTDEQQAKEKIAGLRDKYPHGSYWAYEAGAEAKRMVTIDGEAYEITDTSILSDIVTAENPEGKEDMILHAYMTYNLNLQGSQCYGFAMKLSDEIFTADAPVTKIEKGYDNIRIGDHIRFQGHSVVVIDKTDTYATVAEGNFNGLNRINWDRKISRETFDKEDYEIFTRY